MNFLHLTRASFFLLLILALASALRIGRADYGFPGLFVSNDEAIFHQSALNMLSQRTPFTLGNYGPLGSYTQIPFLLLSYLVLFLTGKVSSTSDMEHLLLTQEGYLLFIPRIISALFGVLTVIVVYKISKLLFKSTNSALWSAFFVAVSFNLVHISHLSRPWSEAIFFSLLSILFCLKGIKSFYHSKINIILTYIFSAISFGFHQISGIVILFVLLLNIFSKKRGLLKINLVGLMIALALMLLFNYLSLGGDFFTVLKPENRTVGLIYLPDSANPADIWRFITSLDSVPKVFVDLVLTDGVIVLLALSFFLKKENLKKELILILAFILFNLFLVLTIFPPFVRYFLIGFSILPIFAGYQLSMLSKKVPKIFVVLIVFLSIFNSVYWNFLIHRVPTFEQARLWVEKTIPSNQMVFITERRDSSFVPSKRAADIIRETIPGYYLNSSKAIGYSYPANVRDVLYVETFKKGSKAANVKYALGKVKTDFIIDTYRNESTRLLNMQSGIKLKLIKEFSPTPGYMYTGTLPILWFDAPYVFPLFVLQRPGQYIDVLRVE